jgi:hypothetical protein
MSMPADVHRADFIEKTTWLGTIPQFIGLMVVFTLGLIPVYKFDRGGFQIVDPLICVLIITALFINKLNIQIKNHIYLLLPFIIWTALVNIGYYIMYPVYPMYPFPMNLSLMINMVYSFTILWGFAIIFSEILNKKGLLYVYLGLIMAIIAVFTVKGGYAWEGIRFSYSFKNPNQLALFCLITYSIVILLMEYKRENNIENNILFVMDVVIVIIIQYLLWQAMSRAGLAASLFLHIAFIRKLFSKKLFVPVSLAVSLPLIFIIIINPTFIQKRLEVRKPDKFSEGAVAERFESAVFEQLNRLKGVRILYGTGARSYGNQADPLTRVTTTEVHNMFGHVLWVYGIIGVLFYLIWIIKTIWETRILKDGLFIWGAILAFSMSGVVMRSRMYWILLGLMLAMVGLKLLKKEKPYLSDSHVSPQPQHQNFKGWFQGHNPPLKVKSDF